MVLRLFSESTEIRALRALIPVIPGSNFGGYYSLFAAQNLTFARYKK